MRDFLLDRIRLVRELLESDFTVDYADVALILCTVISTCAERKWRGDGIDKHRFIELLVYESAEDLHAAWICIPALIVEGHVTESDTPYGSHDSTRIFTDDEIDLTLTDAVNKYPNVSIRNLKHCSYACMIYKWLRCGYSHKYLPHMNITHFPPSRRSARLSYIGRGTKTDMTRMISFHLDYLISLTEYHASNVVDSPSARPNKWWIETT